MKLNKLKKIIKISKLINIKKNKIVNYPNKTKALSLKKCFINTNKNFFNSGRFSLPLISMLNASKNNN